MTASKRVTDQEICKRNWSYRRHINKKTAIDNRIYRIFDSISVQNRLTVFKEATDRFYSKDMSVKEYKGISGGMGSYAQRGAEKGMVRLRLAGGRISKTKLDFICQCIEKYRPEMVHLTTCQSVQVHGLGPEAIKDIVSEAPSVGIHTFGGGGDFPRNITATPLSGLISASRADVMPYAALAEEYLMSLAEKIRLPRKLKVGFSSTLENITDATARDLGFVAREDSLFDVYSGGGLGNNPKLGLLIAEAVSPENIPAYLDAMFHMFAEHGNFENRSKARVRYMRDELGDDGYVRMLREYTEKNLSDPAFPKFKAEPEKIMKHGDGSVPRSERARPQIQDGLFYVTYHPIYGDPASEKILEIRDAIRDIENAEVRISPNETMYIVNLTGSEADKIAEITSDGSRTVFEASVSCVGATICQIGLRDSPGLLEKLIEMEHDEGFADRILPMIRISGCSNSCAVHQVGTMALCGAPSIDGQDAFSVFVNGSHILGKERLGEKIGNVKVSDLPKMFRVIGRTVTGSGTGSFLEWYRQDPEKLLKVCRPFLH